jgi:hypothetical protein
MDGTKYRDMMILQDFLDTLCKIGLNRDYTLMNVPNCWDLWWNNIRDYDVGLNRLHNQNSFRKI